MKPSPHKPNKESKLQKLVKSNSHFQFIENGKIKCKLTGHEMLPTLQDYQDYLKSKSYKRGAQAQYDISQYEDIIIPHKDSDKFLFCQLTGVRLAKRKSIINRHIAGKKFQRRLQQYRNQQQQGEGVQQHVEQNQHQGNQQVLANGNQQSDQQEDDKQKTNRPNKNGKKIYKNGKQPAYNTKKKEQTKKSQNNRTNKGKSTKNQKKHSKKQEHQ